MKDFHYICIAKIKQIALSSWREISDGPIYYLFPLSNLCPVCGVKAAAVAATRLH